MKMEQSVLIFALVITNFSRISIITDKKVPGKSKDEQMAEKKQELEKRLLDVNDKIGNAKKAPKKGLYIFSPYYYFLNSLRLLALQINSSFITSSL